MAEVDFRGADAPTCAPPIYESRWSTICFILPQVYFQKEEP